MLKKFWQLIESHTSFRKVASNQGRLTSEGLAQAIQDHLPKYLSASTIKEVCADLAQFPEIHRFYGSTNLSDQCIQGDGWRAFVYPSFQSRRWIDVAGIVLSNSCDIALANKPAQHQNILFAPILSLEKYLTDLEKKGGFTKDQVDSVARAIRNQYVTNVFYLPALPGKLDEAVVPLDDIHPHPIHDFYSSNRDRLFSLTESAFMIFLLKLSIHFTRIHGTDGVSRSFS